MATAVGIFDSGVGGLTVGAALHRLLPALPIRYIADTAYFPYGERSAAEVEARSRALTARLIAEGCDLVVVACNTASSAALERLRAEFAATPIVGMEPPLKPAVERTRTKRVAVLATPGTVSGERLARLRDAHGGDVDVVTLAMPGLADLVESGEVDGERVESMLRAALDAAGDGIDEVALGCTHYGFLRPALEALVDAHVEVLDAAEPVARRVHHQLKAHALDVPEGAEVVVQADATGDIQAFRETVARLRAAHALLPPIEFGAGGERGTA